MPVGALHPGRYEPHMAAGGGHLQVQPRAFTGLVHGVTAGAQKGVVAGVEQKGWDANPVDEEAGAALAPVFLGVLKPVGRGRITVVEFAKSAQPTEILGTQPAVGTGRFHPRFGAQGSQKAKHIDATGGSGHGNGAVFQVAGHRNGSRPTNVGCQTASLLPNVLEHQVAPQAETDQADGVIDRLPADVAQHGGEVFRGTTVVGAQPAVGNPAAAPEIDAQGVPAGPVENPHHAAHVRRLRAALETMAENDQPLAVIVTGPVQIQKIVIRGGDAFALVANAVHPSQQ